MTPSDIRNFIIKNEGWKNKIYPDDKGIPTVGVGRNLNSPGLRDSEISFMLDNDIQECIEDLVSIFPDYDKFSRARQIALCDLRFNLGPNRFRTFKNMIGAIHQADWDLAATEVINSDAGRQLVKRYLRNAKALKEG